jgi:Zn-dependent M28 family amino/carboxypeptidase
MDSNTNASQIVKYIKLIIPIVGIGIVLTIVSLALTITTLVRVNKGFDDSQTDDGTSTISSITTTTVTNVPSSTTVTNVLSTTTVTNTPSTTRQPPPNSTLSTFISIEDVMNHLDELQRIATTENETRAVNTAGFNRTLDYITDYLTANTNYTVTKSFFPVRQFNLERDPILLSSVNGIITNHTYSTNLANAEIYHVQYSTSANFQDYVELSAIPDVGCTDADWQNASSSVAGRVALVKRGNCTFIEKAAFASKYNAAALLMYNDGELPNRTQPILTNLGQTNTIPALFLSYGLGQQLVDAAQDPSTNASVFINIVLRNEQPFPVGNICADTPTGDVTQTIVIGSHSDSVPAGPGINDNGE